MEEWEMSKSKRREVAMSAVRAMISDNLDVARAFAAMRHRGIAEQDAQEEIARAFLGCLWEAQRNMPGRWPAVLLALEHGKSAAELFPDALYDTTRKQPQ
jgi:hypothetical protein